MSLLFFKVFKKWNEFNPKKNAFDQCFNVSEESTMK